MSGIPEQIGRYRVEAVLGRGAMGVIYRAHDPDIDRMVALKVIQADLLDGEERANSVPPRSGMASSVTMASKRRGAARNACRAAVLDP